MPEAETETIRAIACKRCAKLQRLKTKPLDPTGRPALFFKMSCLKCHGTETYASEDIVLLKARRKNKASGSD